MKRNLYKTNIVNLKKQTRNCCKNITFYFREKGIEIVDHCTYLRSNFIHSRKRHLKVENLGKKKRKGYFSIQKILKDILYVIFKTWFFRRQRTILNSSLNL